MTEPIKAKRDVLPAGDEPLQESLEQYGTYLLINRILKKIMKQPWNISTLFKIKKNTKLIQQIEKKRNQMFDRIENILAGYPTEEMEGFIYGNNWCTCTYTWFAFHQ